MSQRELVSASPRSEHPADTPRTNDFDEVTNFVRSIAISIFEVLVGDRPAEQLVRWLSAHAFRELMTRAVLAERNRVSRGIQPKRQRCVATRLVLQSRGVVAIEAVVLLQITDRTRSVPMRLERLGSRWSVTSVHLI